MKIRLLSSSLLIICVALVAVPAMAGTAYDNGPVNGTTDAWAFSGGFALTNSFRCCREDTGRYPAGFGEITGFSGWFWIAPGDSITGVELSIGTSPFGNDVSDATLGAPTASDCFSNEYGYQVCDEAWTFAGVQVGAGTYWLTLQNGTTAFGTQPFWDENSGAGCMSGGCPSTAMLNEGIGTIPSEAFTLTDSGIGTTPEPSSIALFGSGVLGLAGVLRRKLTR